MCFLVMPRYDSIFVGAPFALKSKGNPDFGLVFYYQHTGKVSTYVHNRILKRICCLLLLLILVTLYYAVCMYIVHVYVHTQNTNI